MSTRIPGKMEKIPVPKWQKIRITPHRGWPGQEQFPAGHGAWGAQGLALLRGGALPVCPGARCCQTPVHRALPPKLGLPKERAGAFLRASVGLVWNCQRCQEMLLFLPFPGLGDDKHRGLPAFSCDPSRRGGLAPARGEGRSVIV